MTPEERKQRDQKRQRETMALITIWKMCEQSGDAGATLDRIARVLRKVGR